MCIVVVARYVLCLCLRCTTWGGHRRPFPDVGLRWRRLPGHRWVLRRRNWTLGQGVRMVISHPLPGVLRASTSEKPLELTRLVKQCSDILKLCDWDWHGTVLRTGWPSSEPKMLNWASWTDLQIWRAPHGHHISLHHFRWLLKLLILNCSKATASSGLVLWTTRSSQRVQKCRNLRILCCKTVARFQGDIVFL